MAPLVPPKPAPKLNIPESSSTVDVSIIDRYNPTAPPPGRHDFVNAP
jgi:hypothetical protein